jgi:hypothetical protein
MGNNLLERHEMIYLMFLSALALSASAAYYSIAGLVAIFSAAVMPIMIMGGTLEVAKLVIASWLYHNWKEVPVLMKTYFTIALIVLMCLTSMGIFGFLSKAHLDQAVPTGDVAAKVALIDEKIKTEKETIDAARKTIIQLDSQVDQTIARTSNDSTDSGIRRSIGVRKSQAGERKSIYATIEEAQKKIATLNEERAPIATELRKVEAEVGPIKYIAALIYGDNPNADVLEKAVRWVIILIVSVFDPLAVLMLVAANWSLKHSRKEETIPQDDDPNFDDDKEVWDDFFKEEPEEKVEWPEDEDRVDIIGMNGNEGLHYAEVDKGWDPKFDLEEPEWLKGDDVIPSPKPPTIAEEVENLQSVGVTTKTIGYDSIGRRITP